MPVKRGKDSNGSYYRWGSQKKYYFTDEATRKLAKIKAIKQAWAIAKGWKPDTTKLLF